MLRRADGMLVTGKTFRQQSRSSESQRGHEIVNSLLNGVQVSFRLNLCGSRIVQQNPLDEDLSAFTVEPVQMHRSVGAPEQRTPVQHLDFEASVDQTVVAPTQQHQVRELCIAALSPVPVYVRVHSLLVTGDWQPALKWGSTNAYTED